jgi:hypothetical protein
LPFALAFTISRTLAGRLSNSSVTRPGNIGNQVPSERVDVRLTAYQSKVAPGIKFYQIFHWLAGCISELCHELITLRLN